VFVSFNDGDDWQPLRLNMPATSIRDLVVHGDDLVVGTHGRSFWILDDVTPLRQINAEIAAADAHLFAPQVAYRVRWNTNPDTPLPPEEPAGKNPPDGAILNYYLKAAADLVTLEILDDKGKLVRRFSSADRPEPVAEKELAVPTYWIRPPQTLSAEAGSHRFVWDLHFTPPPGRPSYPISAIYHDTASEPKGPWVLTGQYRVRLTVGGKTQEQPLTVKMDPRVKTPPADLVRQFEMSMQCYEGMQQADEALGQVRTLRARLKELQGKAGAPAEALTELDRKAAALAGSERRRGEPPMFGGARQPSLARLEGELQRLLHTLQGADEVPTSQAVAACAEVHKALADLLGKWKDLRDKEVKALDEQLRGAGLPLLTP
jgi:hypothetical protein